MKKDDPMKKLITVFLFLVFLFGMQQGVDAHSTKGRIKVPLKKSSVTVDDMAFYIESYVHRKKYKELYEKSRNRFYVRDFIKVEQKEKEADVFFTVLDVKENRSFEDSMSFTRANDGTWVYMDEKKKNVEQVFTYVPKMTYYYNKYVLPVSCAGIILAGGIFIFFRVRRLKEKS